ncbi:MAG: M28 family metallopeptidase [Steroidobacteraceae bacterium]|nr:M28 family metallopeptidase [Steroidobacteraceae bacterium]
MIPTRLLAAAGALAAALLAGCAATTPAGEAAYAPAFDDAAWRAHVERLASDEFEGRAPGTPGEEKTLAYLEQQFRAAGLEPGAGGSFRQAVPLVELTTRPDPTMEVRGKSGALSLRYAEDYVSWTRRPVPESRVADAEFVFAGYGIVAPEYGWNDYAGLDVKGKIVLALVNDPGYATGDTALFTGRAMTYYGRWTYKFEEAVRQGAAGLLVIHETGPAGYPWDVPRNGAARPQLDLELPDYETKRLALEGWITEAATRRILALAGEDFDQLKGAALARGSASQALGVTATTGVRNIVRHGKSYNVVGVLPGRERPDEHFLYSAHWDHLGRILTIGGATATDTVFNGAIDNATGTAALIELARAFGATQPRPERSLMFVAFTAEESGLLGSKFFGENLPVPAAQIAGGVNMDALYVLGETRDLTVIGYGNSELDAVLRDAAAKRGMVLIPESTPEAGYYYRSDHFNLAKQGVPMLYAKSGVDSPKHGPEHGKRWLENYIANVYHKPNDEYDPAWDTAGILKELAIYFDVGLTVANGGAWPQWREGSEFRAIREKTRAAR